MWAACELAERTSQRLAILAVERHPVDAKVLTASARKYVAGFDLGTVEAAEKKAGPDHTDHILSAASELEADFIVVGGEPQGLLARLFQSPTAEEVVLATRLPVLIAR